jgi:hypothetical protein
VSLFALPFINTSSLGGKKKLVRGQGENKVAKKN